MLACTSAASGGTLAVGAREGGGNVADRGGGIGSRSSSSAAASPTVSSVSISLVKERALDARHQRWLACCRLGL